MNRYDVEIGDQFGIIKGNTLLVFIKTGRGGTIYGHDSKYFNLCISLHEKYGCSFVVSANPVDSTCNLEDEIRQITEYVGDYDKVFFIGVSNGALVGAQQCYKVDDIKNALLINGPLMINWSKTKRGAEAFKGGLMRFVYGDQDPSYKYFEILDCIENEACEHVIVKGEGHRMSDETFETVIRSFLGNQMNMKDTYP